MAREYLDSQSSRWRSIRYRNQVSTALLEACRPIASRLVSEITTQDVLSAAAPVAERARTTAQRLVRLIEAVLDRAQRHGFIPHDRRNPAAGLCQDLPKPADVVHHAALDYHETPAFMNALRDARRDRDGSLRVDNLALEFTILTAARTKEVRLAVWDEIDLPARPSG